MNKNERFKRFELGLPTLDKTVIPFNVGLTEGSHPLAQWLAIEFNHNFNEYDRAIDSVYNSIHIGGSQYHHILDGQHSFLGALHAAHNANIDDSFLRELVGASEHLLRDTASISGINPFFSLTPDQFNHLSDLTQQIGVSKPFLADALTVNGPEPG